MSCLILGLGNPGDQYRTSRHNVGFRVVEELARRWQVSLDRSECNSLTALATREGAPRQPETAAEGDDGGGESPVAPAAPVVSAAPEGPAERVQVRVLLAAPQTYMNRSGFAARCLVESHALAATAVLVVYDELNLPLGRLRLRRSGSPAGHRGIESILENLRTDQVARLRIGIAPSGDSGALPGGVETASAPAAPQAPPVSGEALVDFVLGSFTAAEEETLAPAIRRAADACETWVRDGMDVAMRLFNGAG